MTSTGISSDLVDCEMSLIDLKNCEISRKYGDSFSSIEDDSDSLESDLCNNTIIANSGVSIQSFYVF